MTMMAAVSWVERKSALIKSADQGHWMCASQDWANGTRAASPFDHDEWLFEIKHDGFRALAYIEDGVCKLVSRNDHDYKRCTDLMVVMPGDLKVDTAILDGELVVLDDSGKAQFYEMMHGHAPALFAAFDLVWLNGRDLRELPLRQRKTLPRKVIKKRARRTFFVDHIEGKGKLMYQQVCEMDMERDRRQTDHESVSST
jgi:bifunctional non-homologous end joining protein LigD